MNFIRSVGAKTLGFIQSLGSITLFLLNILAKSGTAFVRPRLSVRQVYFAGVLSVLIVAVSGLFVGMVLGLQGYTQLSKFKSADILGYMVAASLLRELGPVLAAVLFASSGGGGGAAADPALLDRARGAGVTVVTTYGMSETGGGCVYNGRPLEGVEITIQAPDAEGAGRILISGPVLAEDYLHTPRHSPAGSPNAGEGFHRSGSTRVLATSDRGRLHPDGRLEVLGRLDDVIITGGVKVEPRHVEEALACIDGVAEACVVGLPDEQWGSTVVAAVVLEPDRQPGGLKQLDGAALREAARARLDGAHAPKRVVVLEALPLRPSGKVDRREVARLLAATATRVTSEPLTPGL